MCWLLDIIKFFQLRVIIYIVQAGCLAWRTTGSLISSTPTNKVQLFGETLHYCSRFVVIEGLHFIQWTVWWNTAPETGCLAWKIKGSLISLWSKLSSFTHSASKHQAWLEIWTEWIEQTWTGKYSPLSARSCCKNLQQNPQRHFFCFRNQMLFLFWWDPVHSLCHNFWSILEIDCDFCSGGNQIFICLASAIFCEMLNSYVLRHPWSSVRCSP